MLIIRIITAVVRISLSKISTLILKIVFQFTIPDKITTTAIIIAATAKEKMYAEDTYFFPPGPFWPGKRSSEYFY